MDHRAACSIAAVYRALVVARVLSCSHAAEGRSRRSSDRRAPNSRSNDCRWRTSAHDCRSLMPMPRRSLQKACESQSSPRWYACRSSRWIDGTRRVVIDLRAQQQRAQSTHEDGQPSIAHSCSIPQRCSRASASSPAGSVVSGPRGWPSAHGQLRASYLYHVSDHRR